MARNNLTNKEVKNWIRAEFNRANNYISMSNHAALQGGEEYWNRLNEIKQPTLIIQYTEQTTKFGIIRMQVFY